MVVLFSVALTAESEIRDNLGNTWEPTGENLVLAFQTLQDNGELWLPSTTMTVTENLVVSKSNVKIHGGNAKIVFENGSKLISSKNPYMTSDTLRFASGNDYLTLSDFTFTGDGQLEIVLGNHTQLSNVRAEYTYCKRPGAFRFVLPTHGYVHNLSVIKCSAYKVFWHGFVINSALAGTYEISDVLFYGCKSSYAGWEYPGRGVRTDGNWSVGFDIAENYGGSILTVRNVLVKDCLSEYSWESGFHMENSPTKINVTFENCKANYNGQKRNYVDVTGKTYYCSGFLASSSETLMKNCEANYNTRFGFRCSGNARIQNCMGVGNWEAFSNGCVI